MSFFGFFWILVIFIIVLNILGSIAKRGSPKGGASGSGKWLKDPAGFFNASTRNEAWMHAAGEMGFSFLRPAHSGGTPEISGRVDRMDVTASCAPAENGFAPETVYRVKFNTPLKIGLLIMKDRPEEVRRFFSGRRQYNSLIDFLPDDMAESAVSAYEEKELKAFLTPDRAREIVDGAAEFPRFRIDDDTLTVRYPGIESNVDRFVSRFNRIIALGKCLSEKSPSVSGTEIRPVPVVTPDSMPHLDDIEVKRKLARKTAEEPVIAPESAVAEKPSESVPEPVAEPVPAPVEEVPVAAATGSDAMPSKEQMLAVIWRSSSVGPKEKEFFEKYKGQSVCWDGVLKTAYDYSTDFVFGSGGGVKGTLEIYEMTPGGSLLRTKIKAVVSFPKEDAPILKNASGKTVLFEGNLLKLEPFAREIYLTDGKIVRVDS